MSQVNDWGFKVSQEGSSVKTCIDEELIASSSFNMLKTSSVGLSGGGTTNVPHGLGYIPMFLTSVQGSGKGTIMGDDRNTTCDTTNLTVPASTKYYIFYNEVI